MLAFFLFRPWVTVLSIPLVILVDLFFGGSGPHD